MLVSEAAKVVKQSQFIASGVDFSGPVLAAGSELAHYLFNRTYAAKFHTAFCIALGSFDCARSLRFGLRDQFSSIHLE